MLYLLDGAKSNPDSVHQSPGDFRPGTRDDSELGGPPEEWGPSGWKKYWNNRIRTEHRPLGEEILDRGPKGQDHQTLCNFISRQTDLQPGEFVLGLGCGSGKTLEVLRTLRGIKGIGVDYSQEAIDWANEYDAVLALSTLHNFFKEPQAHRKLERLLQRLNTRLMIFQPHATDDPQMKGAYRNYGPRAFADLIMERAGFDRCQRIGGDP